MQPYYLTTPIYYANDLPTIGHAYTTIAADIIARYQRLQGRDVRFVTGTDEHGINIERIAAQHGTDPQRHVDRVTDGFRSLWQGLDITYDQFVRTTSDQHRRAALELWHRLQQSGDLYRGTYAGTYCARCEAYYQPDELVDGDICPIHRLPCERVSEENWFFRLSRYADQLEPLIAETDFVQPAWRRNELLGQLRAGLTDFSATRQRVTWGIPVPGQPDEVLYVWVDALASYLAGAGFPDEPAVFERYWPADVHLVGKEIIRFHCLYWPALLLSAGLPLPKRVFAHGWLTRDGHKISKTTGNSIDPVVLAEQFGADAVRYYFVRAIPFGQDGDFTQAAFVARYNADLANDFGNFVQRATTLASRHAGDVTNDGALTEAEDELRTSADRLSSEVAAAHESLALHEAAGAVGEFVRAANRYLEATAPWRLARDGDVARLSVVLAHAVEAGRVAAWHYAPVIPRAAEEAHCRLAGTPPLVGGATFDPARRPVSSRVGSPLFPRVAT